MPFSSEDPVIESVWFKTPYAYMATNLLALFDELMRTIITFERIGILIDKKEPIIRQQWLDQLLSLFQMPLQWKPLTVTRTDLTVQNQTALAAIEKMGVVPEAVLLLKIRAPFSPAIKS